ncbi:hypothetical protein VTN77DRAFT_1139 [Rasamsonia byssochlamydoides]|uniref:uncharacterized protein n=1 Tax=Rasamsonia byssochlamydoides TaxID=89139 RepID=UPI003743104C
MMAATNTTTVLFPPRCGMCGKTENLLRCSRCKVMVYCNREHQAAHREAHKSACNAVGKKRTILEAEEEKLRSHPGDFLTPADVFNTSVGHFWGIWETRDYMRARYALVEALGEIKTHDAVQTQLDHLMDMLRLCRGDNMGLRNLVPVVMLRLNKDQECYDFVKWWNAMGSESDYDWGNMELPYLDIKNADAFEPVDYLWSDFPDLSRMVAITLLKIKLLLDVIALENSAATVGKKVPPEILDAIQPHVARSPIIAGNKAILERKDHRAAIIDKLGAQVDRLYKAVDKTNRYFWPSLLKPGRHLTARPEAYSRGSMEEMQLMLQYSYDAWIETPGAIEVIKAKVEGGQIYTS